MTNENMTDEFLRCPRTLKNMLQNGFRQDGVVLKFKNVQRYIGSIH